MWYILYLMTGWLPWCRFGDPDQPQGSDPLL
jgi:hypothetical protein